MTKTVQEARTHASRHYVFRTTTDQLQAHLDHIIECGDAILTAQYVGGRDWVLVCIKAADHG